MSNTASTTFWLASMFAAIFLFCIFGVCKLCVLISTCLFLLGEKQENVIPQTLSVSGISDQIPHVIYFAEQSLITLQAHESAGVILCVSRRI